jgi:2-dehydropantoate 2-reductase
MRFLIAGAGAIGGYIGAKLAQAGEDVTLFARGPHLEAMRQRGLRVIGDGDDFEVHPRIIGDLNQTGAVDVIFLGVKAHGLTQLAPHITHLIGEHTTVVSTQNGVPWWFFQFAAGEFANLHLERVDPGGVIANSIDQRSVIGSIAYFSTDIAEPGVIRHNEGNRISLGEPDGSRSDRVRAIAERLVKAGLRAPVTARLRHEIWVKILGNVAFNPISALTRATLEQIVHNPGACAGPQHYAGSGGGRGETRYRVAGVHRPTHRGCGKSRGTQNVDVAGSRSRPSHGNRSDRGSGGRTRRTPKRHDAAHAQCLRLR